MLATQAAKVHITLFPSSSVYFQQTLMTFPDFQALNFLIFYREPHGGGNESSDAAAFASSSLNEIWLQFAPKGHYSRDAVALKDDDLFLPKWLLLFPEFHWKLQTADMHAFSSQCQMNSMLKL